MLIGICGKSGCGKSTLARRITEQAGVAAVHVDMDKLGHRALLLPEVKNELMKAFGNEVFTNHEVDRKKLAPIVFHSPKAMEVLTDITWKYMEQMMDAFLLENSEKLIVMDWLLLPKTKYFKMCACTVLLDIPYAVREQRVMERDHISAKQFRSREDAAMTYDKSMFDFIFTNEHSFDDRAVLLYTECIEKTLR